MNSTVVSQPGRGSLSRLRTQAASAAKSALLRFGAYSIICSVLPSRQVAILRYHAICGEEGYAYGEPGICISPAAFESHVRYVANHYVVLPLPELVRRLRDGAARTLHRYGLSGIFCITAGCLAGGKPFWLSELLALLRTIPGTALRLRIPDREYDVTLASVAERTNAFRTIRRVIKSHPIPVRESLLDQLRAAAGHVAIPEYMLRWEQVAEMHRLGMTVGSHTMTHPNLPLAGLHDAAEELRGAKARLEREIGAEVTMFSYPNGGAEKYMTPDIARLVRAAGYHGATTSRNAFAGPHSDLFALERIQVRERLEDLVFALEIERFAFRPAPRKGEFA